MVDLKYSHHGFKLKRSVASVFGTGTGTQCLGRGVTVTVTVTAMTFPGLNIFPIDLLLIYRSI